MTQTELEKTQLEIAKLQLEQERHKLAQLQKRQRVVDDLGQGTVAVGGAAVRGVAWVAKLAVFAAVGAVVGMTVAALIILKNVSAPDGLSWLEGVGYRLGAHHTALMVSAFLGVLLMILASFAEDTRKR